VGLNLQNASTVVNMDLPWNPAVLDQRIGRVHRMGQHRPVRVVNFVAQGTIEHSMLSLLSFKQSMFAGVLDGGQSEVFLGGSRLKRFMESVDQVTGAIPPSMPSQEDAVAEASDAVEAREPAPVHGPVPTEWEGLLSAGLSFLDKLGGALSDNTRTSLDVGSKVKIETDEASGQRHMRVPLPSKKVLSDLAGLLSRLAEKLWGKHCRTRHGLLRYRPPARNHWTLGRPWV